MHFPVSLLKLDHTFSLSCAAHKMIYLNVYGPNNEGKGKDENEAAGKAKVKKVKKVKAKKAKVKALKAKPPKAKTPKARR